MKLSRNIIRTICMLIVLTLVLHAIVILNVKSRTGTEKRKRVVRDHEEALCNFRFNMNDTIGQPREECPQYGIVTVFYGGCLTVQVCAYSSVLVMSALTGLQPFVPICMYTYLSKVFKDLSIPPLSRIAHCDIPLPDAAQSYEYWSDRNTSLVLPVFTCMSEVVLKNLNILLAEFRFKDFLVDNVRTILRGFAWGRLDEPIFVGVHVIKHWEYESKSDSDTGVFPDEDYYHRAFGYLRKVKNNKTLFIVVSDFDVPPSLFGEDDVFFVNTFDLPKGTDLALLSMCNMSVVCFEGVGQWGAVLSRGETLVFDASDDRFGSFLRVLPNWQRYQ